MTLTLAQEKKIVIQYYDLLIEGKEPIFNFQKGNLIFYSTKSIVEFIRNKQVLDYDEVYVTLF